MAALVDTTAVILAGGLGTRLRSVVGDRPKVLAETFGRPFLSHLLDQLKSAGIRTAVLCTGYLGAQVQAAFGNRYGNLAFQYSQESRPLGTGGALRSVLSLCGSDPILVLNGDSFLDVDFDGLWNYHHAHAARATLALVRLSDTRRFGRVTFAEEGHVLAFQEKGARHGPGWINAGIYLLSRRLLSTIPLARPISLERESFPAWIGAGLYGYPCQGRFLDIGTPESYAAANEFFARLAGLAL